MLSLPPSRSNNYRVAPDEYLTSDIWNSTVGDLALRMASVETKATGYDTLVAAGTDVLLQRINGALAPAVDQISSLIQQANTYLSQLQKSANGISGSLVAQDSTHRFVSDTQLGSIAQVATVSAALTALSAKVGTATAGRAYFLSLM